MALDQQTALGEDDFEAGLEDLDPGENGDVGETRDLAIDGVFAFDEFLPELFNESGALDISDAAGVLLESEDGGVQDLDRGQVWIARLESLLPPRQAMFFYFLLLLLFLASCGTDKKGFSKLEAKVQANALAIQEWSREEYLKSDADYDALRAERGEREFDLAQLRLKLGKTAIEVAYDSADGGNRKDLVVFLEKALEIFRQAKSDGSCPYDPNSKNSEAPDGMDLDDWKNFCAELGRFSEETGRDFESKAKSLLDELERRAERSEDDSRPGSPDEEKLYTEILEVLNQLANFYLSKGVHFKSHNETKDVMELQNLMAQKAEILAGKLGKKAEAAFIYEELERYEDAMNIFYELAKKHGVKNNNWQKAAAMARRLGQNERACELLAEGEFFKEAAEGYMDLNGGNPSKGNKGSAAELYETAGMIKRAAKLFLEVGDSARAMDLYFDQLGTLGSTTTPAQRDLKIAVLYRMTELALRQTDTSTAVGFLAELEKNVASAEHLLKTEPKPEKALEEDPGEARQRESDEAEFQRLKTAQSKLDPKTATIADYIQLAEGYRSVGKYYPEAALAAAKAVKLLHKEGKIDQAKEIFVSYVMGDENLAYALRDLRAAVYTEYFEKWFGATFGDLKNPANKAKFKLALGGVSDQKLTEMIGVMLYTDEPRAREYYDLFSDRFKLELARRAESKVRAEDDRGRIGDLVGNYLDASGYDKQDIARAEAKFLSWETVVYFETLLSAQDPNLDLIEREAHGWPYFVKWQLRDNGWSVNEWGALKRRLENTGDRLKALGLHEAAAASYRKAGVNKVYRLVSWGLERLGKRNTKEVFSAKNGGYLDGDVSNQVEFLLEQDTSSN